MDALVHSAFHFEYPFPLCQIRRPSGVERFPACTLLVTDLVVMQNGALLLNEEARAAEVPFEVRLDEWAQTEDYGFSLTDGYVVISRNWWD